MNRTHIDRDGGRRAGRGHGPPPNFLKKKFKGRKKNNLKNKKI
jgi:hypothetical protein